MSAGEWFLAGAAAAVAAPLLFRFLRQEIHSLDDAWPWIGGILWFIGLPLAYYLLSP